MWEGDISGSYTVVVTLWLSGFFIFYFIVLDICYLTFILIGISNLRKYRHYVQVVDYQALLRTSLAKPISLLVPAYNEEKNILETVRSLLTLQYSQFEIIVINDGSDDGTIDVLKQEFNLVARSKVYQKRIKSKPIKAIYESDDFPNLVVIDKVNGGKSDALNVGINVSRYPFFCTLDADSLVESDALLKMIRPFIEHPDTMVAVGGVIRVANNCVVDYGRVKQVALPTNWLALTQVVEYLQSFLSSRIAFSEMNMVLLISGAFGMFRKSTVIEAGGYRSDTIGEDMELVVRMNRMLKRNRQDYKIFFTPDPVCWTEVPTDLASLSRQRKRWQKGLVDSLRYNADMLFNPRYGSLGMFAMPYYLLFELGGPVVEIFGYVLMVVFAMVGVLSWHWTWLFFLLSVAFGFLFSVTTILLEELSFHRYPRARELLGLIWGGFLYNCGFRQINAVWRLMATLEYLGGLRFWGKMRRTGFRTEPSKQGVK